MIDSRGRSRRGCGAHRIRERQSERTDARRQFRNAQAHRDRHQRGHGRPARARARCAGKPRRSIRRSWCARAKPARRSRSTPRISACSPRPICRRQRSSPPPSLLVALGAMMLGAAAGTGIVLVRPPRRGRRAYAPDAAEPLREHWRPWDCGRAAATGRSGACGPAGRRRFVRLERRRRSGIAVRRGKSRKVYDELRAEPDDARQSKRARRRRRR